MKSKIKSGRPLKGDSKRVRTSFTLPPEQIKWLNKQSAKLKVSKSDLVSQIISEAEYCKAEVSNLVHIRFNVSNKLLERFCQKHQIVKMSIFGSALEDRFGPESDIDLLVEFKKGSKITFFTIVRMEEELSKLLNGREIDIRTPAELSPYFKEEVLSKAEVLYAA